MTSLGGESGQVLERLPDRLVIQVLHFLSTPEQHRVLQLSRSLYLQLCCLPFVEVLSFPPEDGSFELLLRPHKHVDLLLQQQSILMEQQRHARDVKRRLEIGQETEEGRELKRVRAGGEQPVESLPAAAAEEPARSVPVATFAESTPSRREEQRALQTSAGSDTASTRRIETRETEPKPTLPLELERQREAQLSGHRKSLLTRCPFLLRFSRVSEVRLAIPTHLEPSAGLVILLFCCAPHLRSVSITGFDEGSFLRRRRREEAESGARTAEGEGGPSQEGASQTLEAFSAERQAELCSCGSVLPGDWRSPNLWLSRPAFTALLEASCRSLEELRLELSLRRGYGVAPLTEGVLEGFKLPRLRFLEIVNITRSNLK